MERGEVQYSRARRSFEKAHGEAAGRAPPARLQVIGFNVTPKLAEGAGLQEIVSSAGDSYDHDQQLSPSALPKPAASSPRSALQQLLLHQSLPSTSSPFSNHSLPPPLPSSPSSNHNLTTGLLQLPPSPPAANHKSTIADQLLQPAYISPPAANQNCTSGFSKFQSPPASAHSSSGRFKSLRQSDYACSSDVPANQSSRTSFFSSLGQSQCASSSSSVGNQSMRGSGVSVNMQIINQHNSKPSCKALIKESYEAFFQIKQTGDDHKIKEINNGSDAEAHEMISAKDLINGLPFVVAKSQRSSWLHDDIGQYPSAEKCKKSSCKGVQQIHEHPVGNEKSRKSSWNEKKSSLFIFMASSPAVEFHHHQYAEHNTSENMDFLSSCHLCRRLLGEGQDVFMYSGDKAFCSMECRYQQIVMDERKERCPPPIIRSGASQVYQHSSVTATTASHHPIMINKPHFINTAAAA